MSEKTRAMAILGIEERSKGERLVFGQESFGRDAKYTLNQAKIRLGLDEDKRADRSPKYTREEAKRILDL